MPEAYLKLGPVWVRFWPWPFLRIVTDETMQAAKLMGIATDRRNREK